MIPASLEEFVSKLESWDNTQDATKVLYMAAKLIQGQLSKVDRLENELTQAYEKIEELNKLIIDTESELTVSYMFGYDRGKEDARKGLGE